MRARTGSRERAVAALAAERLTETVPSKATRADAKETLAVYRRKRDFSGRIPTLKLPFRFRVQYSVKLKK